MGGLSVAIAVLVLRVCLGPWGGVGLIHWSGLRRGTLGFWEGVGLVEGAGEGEGISEVWVWGGVVGPEG